MNNLAPIVLFVYNRPEHTKKTIQALQANTLASDSELFIYTDAAKNEEAMDSVKRVREGISNLSGFKEVTIIVQKKNIGLANSIISGVSDIVNRYGKIIVLEDDIVTSPEFLTFMNKALNHYQNIDHVWHISGWNYPIPTMPACDDTFLWPIMNCWGWATWRDKWQHFEKNVDNLTDTFTKKDISKFNFNGNINLWSQVLGNKSEDINTWAIFWYATIFKRNGLCLNPTYSYVENIGFDGSGVHCGKTEYKDNETLYRNSAPTFNDHPVDNSHIIDAICLWHKKRKKKFHIRVINKFSRTLLNKNIIT